MVLLCVDHGFVEFWIFKSVLDTEILNHMTLAIPLLSQTAC